MAAQRAKHWPAFKHDGARLAFKHLDPLTKQTGLQKVSPTLVACHEHDPIVKDGHDEVDFDDIEFDEHEPAYIDGSCAWPSDWWLARAAYAVRQTRPDGKCRQVVGAVPSHAPQTAAYAEHLGATIFRIRAARRAAGVVDCNSVITAADNKQLVDLGHHVHADLWHDEDAGIVFRKTKAHRSLKEAEDANDLADFIGNDDVDNLCRNAATALLPAKWELNAYTAEAAAVKAFNQFVGKMLSEYHEHQVSLWQAAKAARREQASRKPVFVKTQLDHTSGVGKAHQNDGYARDATYVCSAA